ncbi:MAG: chromosome segregation protein SMC [Chloroflexi bacterium]|nr:chromosome segregation protein SMC [Chloroflexota bacterium]
MIRLKKLTLHGYKTFANKTELRFGEGITAIVGPNGSGKSNIADAIRWVMGEQAYSTLRGRKTEDMIFSGSNGRARMGMAEVTLTLDNSDNWLPIDFEEVVIGRRAYRSGENEYYLNGNRVRLRDVQELLDRSGLGRRTHTVIGQGMVDQALAQRPEDRRELFEEAAGITVYRHKRRQTMDRLQKTRDNLTRVRDILTEIEPRLRQLERQARRVQQYETLSHELRELLLIWYGHNWHVALNELVDARNAVAHWEKVIAETEKRIQEHAADTAALRERQTQLRAQLAAWRQELSELESQRANLSREKAVSQERLRSVRADIERVHHERDLLTQRRDAERERLSEAEAMLATLLEQRRELEAHVQQAQKALGAQEQERRQTETELTEARRELLALDARIADRENRIAQAKERRAAIVKEREADVLAAEEAETEAKKLETRFQQAGQALQELGRKISDLRSEHQTLEKRRRDFITKRARLEQRRNEQQAQLRALRARLELLDRLRAEGEGLFAGVRKVIVAGKEGRLPGVLGPIATLIEVPDHLEQAIEVALGARIQDVVVRSWNDAEKAIEFLKKTRGGRATFLPLDNLQPLKRRSAPSDSGALGWAVDLVSFSAEVAPAVELLLGQILVVTDLAAARRVTRGGFRPRIVTLEGDYVHPGGSVSGGSRDQRQRGGMLAREREWRALPGQIAKLEEQARNLQLEIEELNQTIGAIDEQLTRLVEQVSALGEREREGAAALARVQSALDRARQKESWHRERSHKQAAELEALGRKLAALREEKTRLIQERAAKEKRIEILEEKLAALSVEGLMQAAAQAQARLDAAEETRRSQITLVQAHRTTLRQIEAEIEQRNLSEQKLAREIESLKAKMIELETREQAIEAELKALHSRMIPAQTELESLESGWDAQEQQAEILRKRLHQEELQRNQAQLARQRAEDHLVHLRGQIEHDFGLVSLDSRGGFPAQEPLPFDRIVTSLPHVEHLPPETENEIRRLKGLINRLGAINPEAQSEYEATKERYDFLSQQAADLEDAEGQLRQVIRELDQLMDQEFRRTFEAVAKAFTAYFTRLFGGGAAKLVLTNVEDITATGVEIIARPPGKRAENLSMLSGGERALTAVALIFAILSVSPLPFVVMDEVDAALDESNIGRVREALLELTKDAQVIIITHNRGTIEVANTIYGVSMGSDSVSQVLSLKLDGSRLAAAA